tara:strand:- start:250 stop:462 length:213 start_codon:yes stop_codon:yes gene_type:complete
MKNDIIGINGSYADIHGGVEKHPDGSFTIYATIQDNVLFHQRYFDYTYEEALPLFKKALQKQTDRYILGR